MMKRIKGLFAYGAIMFLVSCTTYTVTTLPSPSENNIRLTPPVQLPTMTATTLAVSSAPPR